MHAHARRGALRAAQPITCRRAIGREVQNLAPGGKQGGAARRQQAQRLAHDRNPHWVKAGAQHSWVRGPQAQPQAQPQAPSLAPARSASRIPLPTGEHGSKSVSA